jgi:hypothetical protein
MDGYNLDLFTKGLEIEDTTNYFKRGKIQLKILINYVLLWD